MMTRLKQPRLQRTARKRGSGDWLTGQGKQRSVHRLVELEFLDRASCAGPPDFWVMVTTSWHYFNPVRACRGKNERAHSKSYKPRPRP